MKYYLGLGSNLGDRKENLETALKKLKGALNPSLFRVSPVYETPALLPNNFHSEWNKQFLNIACELECRSTPQDLLQVTQKIENESGRIRKFKWQPRGIDIDILLFENGTLNLKGLILPHPEIKNRAFVLDPLKDLNPGLLLSSGESVLALARSHPQHSPLWMAIINLTPDSFSDGGQFSTQTFLEEELDKLIKSDVSIIDIGGESTRPGAYFVDDSQEWERIESALLYLKNKTKTAFIRPLISVDTRHFSTAIKSVECGVDIINDVSGLADEKFASLIRYTNCDYVLTHSLSIPADPNRVLDENLDVMIELKKWFEGKIELLLERGVRKEKIIIDPGIGFGKTAIQSQTILRNLDQFYYLGCRVLVGHSRKSFLNPICQVPFKERDLESVGVSLALTTAGVDILRVHNPETHMKTFLGWNSCRRFH